MMLKIAIIEEMRTTVLEVLKRCHKRYSTFFFAAKIDLFRLTLYDWQPCVSNFLKFRKG